MTIPKLRPFPPVMAADKEDTDAISDKWGDMAAPWVVFEKISGAPFSMRFDGTRTQAANETGDLNPGDSFHDWEGVVKASRDGLELLLEDLAEAASLTVFGILCGPGISKGVEYWEDVDFIAIDLEIDRLKGRSWFESPSKARDLFHGVDFLTQPLIASADSLAEAMLVNPILTSRMNCFVMKPNPAAGLDVILDVGWMRDMSPHFRQKLTIKGARREPKA